MANGKHKYSTLSTGAEFVDQAACS